MNRQENVPTVEAVDYFSVVFLSACTSFHLNWNVIPQKAQEQGRGGNTYNFPRVTFVLK